MTCQAALVHRPTACLTLMLAMLGTQEPVVAQTALPTSTNACLTIEAITPTHLFGLWQLTLGAPEAPGGEGQLTFTLHPEFPGSVRGTLARSAQNASFKALVAGDVTAQGFHLEESADGVAIDAVWSGEVVPNTCGREIRGWRQVVEGRSTREPVSHQPFLLKKSPGWG